MLADKDEIIAASDLSAQTAERDELKNELLVVSELMHQCINENAHVALDQAEYQKRYDDLTERFDKAKIRLDGVAELQPALWYSLADYMTSCHLQGRD